MYLSTALIIFGALNLASSALIKSPRDPGPIDPTQCGWLSPIYPPGGDINNMKVNECRSFALLPLTTLDVKYIVNPDCRCKFFSDKHCDAGTEVIDAESSTTGVLHYLENNDGNMAYLCEKVN
ncbi:hypothetical protein DM02DRAFT_136781 [Periconia macrospinosa]|uniref:Uncharacterized protein n=1 Tax=Periconia macrospinosa TaxID=97972 RepID=A0A2V1DD00_9PLEO|nr:hypothetical protein DM02DRAFT_136781 [Periconia macrospinosa]